MSLFLSRPFIPSPAEPGLAKWHTSEYPLASTSRFSGHPSFQFRISLWPLAWGPLLLEHQAIPAIRVLTKMTGFHRAGLNWLAKQASTVSSGVSPDDERPLYHRESAQMTCALQLGGHPCGWDGLTCQTCVHTTVGHP